MQVHHKQIGKQMADQGLQEDNADQKKTKTQQKEDEADSTDQGGAKIRGKDKEQKKTLKAANNGVVQL